MPASLSNPVLLDNTVLSNFALVEHCDLVTHIWPACATTPEAWREFQSGIATRKLSKEAWKGLQLIELAALEYEFSERLSDVLGAGERSCLAVAKHRKGVICFR